MALKSIDAEHVAEELIPLFARVEVPREILTDQGSNFTSRPTGGAISTLTCDAD